jgi:hypothetical protein
MSDTPETNAAILERRHIHKADSSVQLLELIDANVARELERERNKIQDQRDFCIRQIEQLNKEAAHKDKLLREMRAVIRMVADDSCRGWLL